MKTNIKWLLMLLMAFQLASCGGSDSKNVVQSSPDTGTVTDNTVVTNEGVDLNSVPRPTTVSEYRSAVSNGKFVSARSLYTNSYNECKSNLQLCWLKYGINGNNLPAPSSVSRYKLTHKESNCTVKKSEIFGFLDYYKNKCSSTAKNLSYETSAGQVESVMTSSGTRAQHLTDLIAMIDNSDQSQISGTQLVLIDGNTYRLLDLSRPAGANPVLEIDYNSYGGQDGMRYFDGLLPLDY
ncbi:hypothetical protein HBN50_14050 [Halobacteriovorax sp. GB3]|uniref:hypothetical protein n=1 Tax=Halobacteriovorax sp. GB3 TaxID=2719615 RepID=UPI00235E1F99|nr:hypothetical protein [Halobacteriovorax sp. GB3]MDD0854231.1 hypothetical protein [Halobacteriovorax sp. GB3]